MKAIKPSSRRPARRASLKHSHLNGYLAGAAGTAALLGASQSQAAIVYWNPADQPATPTNQVFVFDMLTGTVTPGSSPTTSGFAFGNNISPDYGLMAATLSLSSGLMGYGFLLDRLTYGTSIGISGPWSAIGFAAFDYVNLAGWPWNTNLDGTTGYVGLRFNIAAATHYGWARFTYDDATSGIITLHDFAYENVAGQSILAGAVGAVPEPGRALLALAGFGAAGLRRRRKQAA